MVDPVLQALQNTLLSISEGSISQAARDAGISLTALSRLRAGKQLNVRVLTLVKLARALGKSTDEVLGLKPPTGFAKIPTDVGSSPGLSSRDVAKLRRRIERFGALAAESLALLPAKADGEEHEG